MQQRAGEHQAQAICNIGLVLPVPADLTLLATWGNSPTAILLDLEGIVSCLPDLDAISWTRSLLPCLMSLLLLTAFCHQHCDMPARDVRKAFQALDASRPLVLIARSHKFVDALLVNANTRLTCLLVGLHLPCTLRPSPSARCTWQR